MKTMEDNEQGRAARAVVMVKVLNDNEGLLCNLYSRWRDECKYEDFAEYITVIKQQFKVEGGEILKVTKSPFGVQLKMENFPFTVAVWVKSNGYGWSSKAVRKG